MLNKLKHGLSLDIDPRRDWKIICGIFLVLVLFILLADIYYFYSGRNSNSSYLATTPDVSQSFDKARLDKIVSDWKDKEVKYNKVLGEKEVLVDPSL